MQDNEYAPPPSSPKQILTTMTILHLALTGGTVIISTVFFMLQQPPQLPESAQLFLVIALAVCVGGILAGNFIGNAQLGVIRQKKSLLEKLRAYQTTLIIRLALLEGSAVFCAIIYFLTGNIYVFGGTALILIFMLLNRPSASKISSDLELNASERSELE
jgi:hypothetical protein